MDLDATLAATGTATLVSVSGLHNDALQTNNDNDPQSQLQELELPLGLPEPEPTEVNSTPQVEPEQSQSAIETVIDDDNNESENALSEPELDDSKRRAKRSFTMEFKLKVVEHAEKTSNLEASRVFKVNPKQVRDWRKKRHELGSPDTLLRKRGFRRTKILVEGGPGLNPTDDENYSGAENEDNSLNQVIKISPSDIENEMDDGNSNFANDAFFDPDFRVKEEPMSVNETGSDDEESIYSSSFSEDQDPYPPPPKRKRRRNLRYNNDFDTGGESGGDKVKSELETDFGGLTDTDGEGVRRSKRPRRKVTKVVKKKRGRKEKTPKPKKEKVAGEKKKRGRPKAPRRLDGTNVPTSEEEDATAGGDEMDGAPVKTGSGYKLEFKMRVLKYAETHSNSATAEKFGVNAKRIREWKRVKDKIGLEKDGLLRRRPRSAGFTVAEKLNAVQFAKERSTDEARLLYGVDRRTIEKWRANTEKLEERLKSGQGDALRDGTAGRKPRFTHIEEKLRDWVLALRLKGVTVNCKMILNKATKLVEEETIPEDGQPLKAPRTWSWVIGFLRRQNLMGLLGTTLGHEDPREILALEIKSQDEVAALAHQQIEIPENPNKRHRRSISLQDKINIINRIEKGETQGIVAKSLGVATSTVQTIWSCRADILRKYLNPKQKPKSVAILWKKYNVIGSALIDWYEQCMLKSFPVDGRQLFDKSVQLSETYRLSEEFKQDSVEWFKQFCKRHKLMEKSNELFPPTQKSSGGGSAGSGVIQSTTMTVPTSTTAQHPQPLSSAGNSVPITVASSNPPHVDSSYDHSTASPDDFHHTDADLDFLTVTGGYHRSNENLDQKVSQLHTMAPQAPHLTLVTHQPIQQQQHQHHQHHHQPSNSNIYAPPAPNPIQYPPTVTITDALKYLGFVRSWIVANYGPGDANLNHHLSSIENAIFKKRPA